MQLGPSHGHLSSVKTYTQDLGLHLAYETFKVDVRTQFPDLPSEYFRVFLYVLNSEFQINKTRVART